MSFKDKLENYTKESKLGSYKTSTMSFLRENFDDITKLISITKNQGNGSAYEKIALWCFEEGIKTKDGKLLPKTYINECLVKIRKEKGIRVKSKVKNSTIRQKDKSKLEKQYIDEEIYNIGLNEVKKFFKAAVEQFSRPDRNGRKIAFDDEQKRKLVLYYKSCSNALKYESLIALNSETSTILNQVKFLEAHKDIFGIK
ncbi:hypothetical protein QYQ99_27385 [Comamonas testosteroni]|uniref:hypothetical protein n=1 Tax=Comamonas testosteroni TaxID=285 RepID=UPI00265EEA0B|nr:hypothetical protein [Comamonas testosteroni]WKL15987.1 hypothetical protein QYQ99_27385 [Comamonas testosteroni]